MEDLLGYLHVVVLPQVIDALIIGVALALVALGLTLIFGLLDVINLAHGDLYMLGGYAAFMLVVGARATGARWCWFRFWSVPSVGRWKKSGSARCCHGRIAPS
jgi:branched-chain amino acid transport system permease protein